MVDGAIASADEQLAQETMNTFARISIACTTIEYAMENMKQHAKESRHGASTLSWAHR